MHYAHKWFIALGIYVHVPLRSFCKLTWGSWVQAAGRWHTATPSPAAKWKSTQANRPPHPEQGSTSGPAKVSKIVEISDISYLSTMFLVLKFHCFVSLLRNTDNSRSAEVWVRRFMATDAGAPDSVGSLGGERTSASATRWSRWKPDAEALQVSAARTTTLRCRNRHTS